MPQQNQNCLRDKMGHGKNRIRYSTIIPVYNSARVVGKTIDRTIAFFKRHKWSYELILVNDGSVDGSWEIILQKALKSRHIVAINLLRNYGQHSAILCGFHHSKGDYVITMDDDLQNPPEEIIHLIKKADDGHDLVIGLFRAKKHAWYRRIGSLIIGALNNRLFKKPKHLVIGNFRILRRDLIERILSYRTNYPYITGLAIMFSANPTNVLVDHQERMEGKSQYSLYKIAEMVMRILFNYSFYPLRLVSAVGLTLSGVIFALGTYSFLKGLIGVQVPGWAILVMSLSFFNGIIILILGMLGEHCIRAVNQTGCSEIYQVKEIIEFNTRNDG